MFSLPIPQILVSLHNVHQQNISTSPTNTTPTTNFGARIASTLQKMGNNISVAADELSDELSALLEATSIASASTREELYSFFDDGFDDDAEELTPGASSSSAMRTPAAVPVENAPQGYFALATSSSKFDDATVQIRQRGTWSPKCQDDSRDLMVDEGYYSSENGDVEMDDFDCGDEEEREALLPAKRFSWRGTSPERCSLLYWEK